MCGHTVRWKRLQKIQKTKTKPQQIIPWRYLKTVIWLWSTLLLKSGRCLHCSHTLGNFQNSYFFYFFNKCIFLWGVLSTKQKQEPSLESINRRWWWGNASSHDFAVIVLWNQTAKFNLKPKLKSAHTLVPTHLEKRRQHICVCTFETWDCDNNLLWSNIPPICRSHFS